MTRLLPASEKMLRESARGIGADALPPCRGDQEHVQAASARLVAIEPRLKVTDRSFVYFDDVRVHPGTGNAHLHLGTAELLVIPEASDLGIGMPPDEKIDIGFHRRTDDGQVATERNSCALLCRRLPD